MNLKNLNKTISLRVSQEQYNTIDEIAKMLNVSKSAYIKMLISGSIASYNKIQENLSKIGVNNE